MEGKILLTTGSGFEGYRITEYIDIITEDIVLKAGAINSLFTNMADLKDMFKVGERELSGTTSLLENGNKHIMKKMCDHAKKIGANAILGVDIETTFGAEVLKISVNGTAVKIEEIKAVEKMELKKILPVINYSNNSPIQFCKCIMEYDVDRNIAAVKLQFAVFENAVPEALQLDLALCTLWKEEIAVDNLSLLQCEKTEILCEAEWKPVALSLTQFNEITAVKCKLKKEMYNEKMVISDYEYADIEMSVTDLLALKADTKPYAVCEMKTEKAEWICLCGNINPQNADKCSRCGCVRRLEKLFNKTTCDVCREMKNAKEIYTYIEHLALEGYSEEVNNLVKELKALADTERMYGNCKVNAMRILEQYVESV